jgi:acetoin utilization deacetylase AcuC-like enzyme
MGEDSGRPGALPAGSRACAEEQLGPSKLRLWSHDRFTFPLPPRHRFPLRKYRLLRERVIADELVAPTAVLESQAVSWEQLALVHGAGMLERLRHGGLSRRQLQAIGLPWSPELVERARRATGGTVAAAHDAAGWGIGMNLGGGTHHAGPDASRGFCLVNDVAVAVAVLRTRGEAERVLVVDCDVHQGDGTAQIFAGDRDTFTLSLHGAVNYPFTRIPSDLDLDLPTGTGDDDYLAALSDALSFALPRAAPDIIFYLAGADPWEGDRLGRLSLSKDGLRARDEMVLAHAAAARTAACVVLAGGYADDVNDTVDINVGTVRAVVEHTAARL